MTTTAYRIAPAPRFAGMRTFDCEICHHEDLQRPVFLDGPNGVIAAGTGCAARLIYGDETAAARRLVRRDYDAVEHVARDAEMLIAERRARYADALVAFQAERDGDEDLAACRRTYHALGGAARLGLLPDFLARVAETGDLPV